MYPSFPGGPLSGSLLVYQDFGGRKAAGVLTASTAAKYLSPSVRDSVLLPRSLTAHPENSLCLLHGQAWPSETVGTSFSQLLHWYTSRCMYPHTHSLPNQLPFSHYPPLPCGQPLLSDTATLITIGMYEGLCPLRVTQNNRPQSQPAEAPLHQCPLFCTFPMLDHCYLHPYQSEGSS